MSVGPVLNQLPIEAAGDRYRNLGCGVAAMLCFAGLIALSAAPLVQRNWQGWGLLEHRATAIGRSLYGVGSCLMILGAAGACSFHQLGESRLARRPFGDLVVRALSSPVDGPAPPPYVSVSSEPAAAPLSIDIDAPAHAPSMRVPNAPVFAPSMSVQVQDPTPISSSSALVGDLTISAVVPQGIAAIAAPSRRGHRRRGDFTVDELNHMTDPGEGSHRLTQIARLMVHEDRQDAARSAYVRLCDRRFEGLDRRTRCDREISLADEVMQPMTMHEAKVFARWQCQRLADLLIEASGGADAARSALENHPLKEGFSLIFLGLEPFLAERAMEAYWRSIQGQ
jgi:hypothetical protein